MAKKKAEKVLTASEQVSGSIERLRHELNESARGMARVRDRLRALIDEAEDYDADLAEAITSIEDANDALSRLV